MRSYGWAVTQYGWCPSRERRMLQEDTDTQAEHPTRMAAGVIWPQAEEYQGSTVTARTKEDFPSRFQGEHGPASPSALDF